MNGAKAVLVRCSCGAEHKVKLTRLRTGKSARCGGCAKKKASRQIRAFNLKHGEADKTPEYGAWYSMCSRCRARASYRGRMVCERWLGDDGYQNFLVDMGRRPSDQHSLDRIDNDGDYEPSNCRWALRSTQQRNKSTTIVLAIDGVSRPLVEWAEITSQPRRRLYSRYYRGRRGREVVYGRS